MRVLTMVQPRFFIPPEALPGLIAGFVAWRERYLGNMEAFEFFAGSAGGFGILNVPDEATLSRMFIEYPFSPYSQIEHRPLLDGDAALRQWQEAAKEMGERPGAAPR
jgi:hypothetical protein